MKYLVIAITLRPTLTRSGSNCLGSVNGLNRNTYSFTRVFANGPRNRSSIPGRIIPKTTKMVLDASLLDTQHYKVGIKGKVSNSGKGVPPHHGVVANEKGAFELPWTKVVNFTLYT